MPVNKNALLRYKIIDRSLRNRYRRWTIEDLVDELDMGDRALRIWVGAGAGAQKITLSGVIFDKNKQEFFDFKHRRIMIIGRTYKKDLQLEFANFGKDIAKILDTLSK